MILITFRNIPFVRNVLFYCHTGIDNTNNINNFLYDYVYDRNYREFELVRRKVEIEIFLDIHINLILYIIFLSIPIFVNIRRIRMIDEKFNLHKIKKKKFDPRRNIRVI